MTNTNPDLDRRVAEWMGEDVSHIRPSDNAVLPGWSKSNDLCALVKARLVERGWNWDVHCFDRKFRVEAWRWDETNSCCDMDTVVTTRATTEPEAIALLACQVAEWEAKQNNEH